MDIPYIFIPVVKEIKKTGILEIMPVAAPDECHIRCNSCGNINVLDKSDVYENKSFACWDCKKVYVIEIIPDSIKLFLKRKQSYNINKRPRIVR